MKENKFATRMRQEVCSCVQITTKTEINQIQQSKRRDGKGGGDWGKGEKFGLEIPLCGFQRLFWAFSSLLPPYKSPLSRREYRHLFWGAMLSFFLEFMEKIFKEDILSFSYSFCFIPSLWQKHTKWMHKTAITIDATLTCFFIGISWCLWLRKMYWLVDGYSQGPSIGMCMN